MKRAEYYSGPERFEKPVISKGKKRVYINGMQQLRIFDPRVSDFIVRKVLPPFKVRRRLKPCLKRFFIQQCPR